MQYMPRGAKREEKLRGGEPTNLGAAENWLNQCVFN